MWKKLAQFFNKKEQRAPTTNNETEIAPLVRFDMETWFPHKFWVSTWSKDEAYPAGFRYKLLSVRNEKDKTFQLVVALEEPGGIKTEMARLTLAPESMFDKAAKRFLDDFTAKYHLEFELEDMSDIRTEHDFEESAYDAGWRDWEPKPPQ